MVFCTISFSIFIETLNTMRKIYNLFLLSMCSTLMLAQTNDVTFVVDMNLYPGTFTTVHVNGTFNGWCGACNPMTDANTDGVWEVTLPITSPDTIEYKFTVDTWTDQENFVGGEPCTVTNGGFTNRQLIFAADTIMDTVCWNFCGTCAQIPPPPPAKNVTFTVDMRESTVAAYTTVNVNGDFNGWCGACNPLTDPDGDSIWSVTLPLMNDSIEYKFTVDGWTGEETFAGGESCTKTVGAFTNRFANLNGDTALAMVCWETCMSCQNAAPAYNVGFQVDMNQYSGTFTTPEVNGLFNGWCGNCSPLTDDNNDGIWSTWIPMIADSMEYKFSVDAWADQEALTPGTLCTKTSGGFTNRFIQLTSDILLPPVCWNECTACTGIPTSGNITFSVDMTQYTGPAYTTVNLNGTFNGWCGACADMLDPDGDSIYELTISVPADTIDFKFTVDGWVGEETFAGGESCTRTVDGFTNRSFIVAGDSILPAYCWETCGTCSGIGLNEELVKNLTVYPNPASDILNISGDFVNGQSYDLSIRTSNGSLVYSKERNASSMTEGIDISNLPNGIYLLNITSGSKVQSTRLAIVK